MFLKYRAALVVALALTLTAGGLTGCPATGSNVQFSLLVSTKALDFGPDTTTLTVKVRKSFSSRAMTPLTVTPNVPWITLQSPTNPAERVSSGPLDAFNLVFVVNRTSMEAGVNVGNVVLTTAGAPPVTISVTAIQRIAADFSASNVLPLVNEPVQFLDESVLAPGEPALTSYLWDFGDGTTSTVANPTKTYDTLGTYTISLTVANANAQSTETKINYITVLTPSGPQADFTSDLDAGVAVEGQPIAFTNLTDTGTAPLAETTFEWDFGDGSTSLEINPVKIYNGIGTYTVSLTATTIFGTDTETKVAYITVDVRVAPTVDFFATPLVAIADEDVEFTATLSAGSLPITGVFWTFGDGDTSTETNPSHAYGAEGVYSVTLQVTTAAETVTTSKTDYITVIGATALDRYVRKPDGNFSFSVAQDTGSSFLIDMISQAWRSAADIYRIYNQVFGLGSPTTWRHKMTISTPPGFKGGAGGTAMLIVGGGENGDGFPSGLALDNLEAIAATTQSIVATVGQVPNQPIVFTDDINAEFRNHGITATSFDRFLDNPSDEEWPALLPMVKSVVRAMDTVQEVMAGEGVTIDNFVLVGHNLQGWTAWLTAAADPGHRVTGIVPLGADLLNMEPATDRHLAAYGSISPVLGDYDALMVFDRFGTLQGDALLEIVDPIAYNQRLLLPKYIINATRDSFWLPDAAEFYFDQLLGDNYINYIPDVDNDLGGGLDSAAVLGDVTRFFQSVAFDETPPSITYTYGAGNTQVTVITSEAPADVQLVTAIDSSIAHRDFRLDEQSDGISPAWVLSPLLPIQGNNTFQAMVAAPPNGWRAYFVQVTFNDGTRQSTEIRVVPNTLPF